MKRRHIEAIQKEQGIGGHPNHPFEQGRVVSEVDEAISDPIERLFFGFAHTGQVSLAFGKN